MEILLNRWRGTGKIFSISIFNITGTIIYALYLGLELILEDSSKWLIINQREIYISFLKGL